ncbi:MAG: phospho-sugar mutase [Mogibacterium diversum]|uniref:phospho-sugar mutase n=1 Tax=Mogibacterium diversum TaxID=114527 RepID=UPI002056AA4B|nr:phospho-sugar mutase [Mogibacterium diversum]UQF81586.1 MAG: phospho-sugar mutase [Mogibacterium diversum]
MEENKAIKNYTEWINAKGIDSDMRQYLMNMISRPEEIESCFSEELDFGTAGMRATMGVGSARMNIYTVATAAYAMGEMLKEKHEGKEVKIVISYDSRNNSRELAEAAAVASCASGVKVLFSDRLRPVPMLSYAIRNFAADGGIMITASHNPKEYNGFKSYRSDGAQMIDEETEAIKSRIRDAVQGIEILSTAESFEDLVNDGAITYFGREIDDSYDVMIMDSFNSSSVSRRSRASLRIVYSPLNGSGREPVRRALRELGYEKVFAVNEQDNPDGDFPSLRVPNPEYDDTYDLAKKYAEMSMADIIIVTDPDSDRLGVAVYDEGEYKKLTGNQIGAILLEYLLSEAKKMGNLPENGYVVTSIVSTHLARAICARYGIKLYETLTGIKNIAEQIRQRSDNGTERFLFGFEESNGYMLNQAVRDKDGVMAAVAIAEIATLSKANGVTLIEQLESLHKLYGYSAEGSVCVEGTGVGEKFMDHLRTLGGKLGEPGTELGVLDVKNCTDYLPDSNVLLYELNGLDWIAFRPSGTEPKFKIYFGFYGAESAAESRLERISKAVVAEVDKYKEN